MGVLLEGAARGPSAGCRPGNPLHPCLQVQGGSWLGSTRSAVLMEPQVCPAVHPCMPAAQGLPPDTTPQHLKQHIQSLLRATGHPEQPCYALDSPSSLGPAPLPQALSEVVVRGRIGADMPIRGDALSRLAPSLTVFGVPQTQALAWRGLQCPRPEPCM